MAIWPFNRRKKQTTTNLPPEVQQYYQSENRGRMGMAWLIAFLSLLVSVAIVVGLFFGGRWVYRQIAGTNDTNATQSETAETKEEVQGGDVEKPAPEPSKENGNNGGQSTGGTATPTPAPAPQSTPQTGDDSLLRTGPDLDL